MIVAPPGDPSARTGAPSRVTIVGAMEERGRLPAAGRLGEAAGPKSKSVSSLLSRKPHPGTAMPLPPVDSIVSV